MKKLLTLLTLCICSQFGTACKKADDGEFVVAEESKWEFSSISPFHLVSQDAAKKEFLSVDGKGNFVTPDADGKPIPAGSLEPDGTFLGADGKLVGSMKKGGSILNANGDKIGELTAEGGRLKGAGTIIGLDGTKWRWSDEGSFELPGSSIELKLEPNTASSRQIAAVYLYLWTMGGAGGSVEDAE